MSNPGLYRDEALEALKSPDQIGRTLRIVRPSRMLAVAVLGLAVLGAIGASAIVRVPIIVKATGVIISSKGVLELPITAQHEGRIASIVVEAGDYVAPGDVIARIEQPELRAEFALAEADRRQIEQELEHIRLVQKDQAEGTHDLNEQNRNEVRHSLRLLGERLKVLTEMRDGVEKLRDRGYATLDRTMQLRSDLTDTEERLAAKRSILLSMDLEEKNQASQFTREVYALQSRLATADRQIARLREQLRREAVVSTDYGVVSDVRLTPGDLVRFDTPIVSLLPTDSTFSRDSPGPTYLVVSVFVSAYDGKKVRPGMEVLVDPRSVRRDIYGNMIGKVNSVSDVPTTTDRMRKMLRNDALARQLSQDGAPFLVEVVLQRDRANPSGFAWTSSKGPDIKITAGTLANAEITTERVTLLSLVLPALREMLRAQPGGRHGM